MGMTIDEAIKELEETKNYPASDPASDEALDFAIDILNKYQMMQADIQKALKEGSKDISESVLAIVREEYISKADYENRLKADMVAMLTKFQMEIDELDFFEGEEPVNITQELMDEMKSWEYGVKECKGLIQQKINALKGEV